MSIINLGNIVGLITSPTEPVKTNVLWAHQTDFPSNPLETTIKYYDGDLAAWTALPAGITDHNSLSGLNGTAPYEHLSSDELQGLRDLLYTAPTLGLSPSSLGSGLEVGDVLNANDIINISITEDANVYLNEIVIDGNTLTLPQASYLLAGAFQFNDRGSNNISEVSIRHQPPGQSVQTITKFVTVFNEFRVGYFWIDTAVDLNLLSDIDKQNLFLAGTTQLKSNKAIGPVSSTPVGAQNFCVCVAKSYGTPVIATQSAPGSPFNTNNFEFDYDNSSIITRYWITRLDDLFGGAVDLIIS